jgi:hypothetical protein
MFIVMSHTPGARGRTNRASIRVESEHATNEEAIRALHRLREERRAGGRYEKEYTVWGFSYASNFLRPFIGEEVPE